MGAKRKKWETGDALEDEETRAQTSQTDKQGVALKRGRKRQRPDSRKDTIDADNARLTKDPANWLRLRVCNSADGAKAAQLPELSSDRVTSVTGMPLSDALDEFYPVICKKMQKGVTPGDKPRAVATQALVVITFSAVRATQLTRELRRPPGREGLAVTQLFAKHYKLEEQRGFLQREDKRWSAAAVGTPQRMDALREAGAWGLNATRLVVIECTADAKERRIWDMQEWEQPLRRMLIEAVWPRAAASKCSVMLYNAPRD